MNSFNNNLVGESSEFLNVLRSAALVARADVTVLLLGETGSGKELAARAIHDESQRAGKPFVAVNCAALQETLAESELFGHRKGAFTGAVADNPGKLTMADGGTLFLDEVGELSLAMQAKFLRFLELGEAQAVGDPVPAKVNVRIIAATNRDLQSLVKRGGFREDLYYRLCVVPINLPPLRERRGDVRLLLETFNRQFSERHNLPAPMYTRDAVTALEHYRWPGNVRELKNFCERMVILRSSQIVMSGNLPPYMLSQPEEKSSPLAEALHLPETGVSLYAMEVEMIRRALEKSNGNKSRAARMLGLTRDTFLYRIKKYAIES